MNLVQLADQPRLSAFHVACSLPSDPVFREWVALESHSTSPTVDQAAAFIKARAGISSRNVLKTDLQAAQRLHENICLPYAVWRRKQEVH
ncbi:hypothetical protein [Burkholderia gladioli]|uniref:hypothetical protein n=1 Tax=Burkholderia gladioli TaxID=28095 RepID=UPI001640ADA1|nr:hypothetical protein [Burkholderia gladioli]